MRFSHRPGFSLLEVMLATTVLLGSVIVLSHIAFVGSAHMDAASQYSAAQLVCQARMSEMLAGAQPIEEVSGQSIPELPGWGLTVKVGPAGQPGLLAIEVTAAEQPADAATAAYTAADQSAAEEPAAPLVTPQPAKVSSPPEVGPANSPQRAVGAGKRFTLVRWIAEGQDSGSTGLQPAGQVAVPVNVPSEPSRFDDSPLPSSPLPSEEPVPAAESLPPEGLPSSFGLPLPAGPPAAGPPPGDFPPPADQGPF